MKTELKSITLIFALLFACFMGTNASGFLQSNPKASRLLVEDDGRDLKEINIEITVTIPDDDDDCGCGNDDDDDVDFDDDGNQNQEDGDDDDDNHDDDHMDCEDDVDFDDDGNQNQEDEDDDVDFDDDGNQNQEDEGANPENDTDDDGFIDLDWVWFGAVIAPTDEETCDGADFAFAIATAMEGRHRLQYGNLDDLSEQYFLDCLNTNADVCLNGVDDITNVLDQLTDAANAVPQNWNYLYTSDQDVCDEHQKYAYISSYTSVDGSSFENIRLALENGPLIARIQDAALLDDDNLGLVKTDCGLGNNAPDQWVNIVGFHEVDGVLAWRVKSSKGPNYADGGYAWIAVTDGNFGVCGINSQIFAIDDVLLA